MKKISLKDVTSSLKRDEMRSIQGGSGNCPKCGGSDVRCWIQYAPGVCTVSGYCGGYYCP